MTMTANKSETDTNNQMTEDAHNETKESTMSRKRPRIEEEQPKDASFQVPVFLRDMSTENAAIQEAYIKCQVLHIPNISTEKCSKGTLTWKDIGALFESLVEDRESWCIENGGNKAVSPTEFLKAQHTGYSSFLLQKDTSVLQETLQRLPVETLDPKWSYGSCVWFFFGVNILGESEWEGRPEHTDSVSHDGTWHYQLSGLKRWFLRPTEELLQMYPQATCTVVDCQEGDVLVVNTRLWWHRTVIPPQSTPSVSFARDFYMTIQCEHEPMSNVDGLYAANDIEEGTILFTENDMPDCELPHSSTNPNCKVVELEDGNSALVSSRLISAGEFFCVAEESSEGDSSGSEMDDDDNDDDQNDDDNGE